MEDNQQQNPSTAEAVEVHEKNTQTNGIDFGSVNALANSDYQKEPWYRSLGLSVAEKLLSLGLFLLGIILDVFKTLWVIVKGIFVGIYKICIGVYHFFRNVVRMCKEGDVYVKCSTFCNGLGNIKGGQVVDGVIFLGVEIIFILYMILFGGTALFNLVFIGFKARSGLPDSISGIKYDPEFDEYYLPNNTSIRFLISGVLTIFVIIAFVFVWYSAVKSAHDNYIIRNNFYFLRAHADQVEVAENFNEYPAFFEVVDKKAKDGSTYKFLKVKRPGEIKRIAREEYGFSYLSARYISYLPLNRYQERQPNGFQRFIQGIKEGFHRGYDKVRTKIKNGQWSSVFGKFLEWELFKPKPTSGANYVRAIAVGEFNKFRHTYDKYNDYLGVTRDMQSLIRVLENPSLVEDAIYARDEVSKKNGVAEVPAGTAVKPKVAASRIVGAFECSYDDGVAAATYYARALKDQPKTGVAPLDQLEAICKTLKNRLETFIRVNNTQLLEGVHEAERLYGSFSELNDLYASGKSVFIEALTEKDKDGKCRYVTKHDARILYKEMKWANKVYNGDPAKVQEHMEKCGAHYAKTVEAFETYPFHGQPMHFKRKAKQYLDEKFAVTVMALPVIGALITTVIPLIVSIIIAFTDYTGANAAKGLFDWDFSAWGKMFAMGDADNMGQTFAYILGWDMIWAVFATFTNYILGIVLALLINKKSIKFKKVYRMFFVISIAIPQFITLLAMSKILGPGGPINQMVYNNEYAAHQAEIMAGTYQMTTRLDTWWLNDPANQGLSAKICLILVNVWIGIPYTMLSTSGILMNIPEDLYESASIDGASPWTQFWKITMPYILFVTGPSLLTTFIGNINNFNVIYFLTGGGPNTAGVLNAKAGYTDLLITFLFKITVESDFHQYSIGAVIGILMFLICAFFSLIMYSRMGSTKNEEAFQ